MEGVSWGIQEQCRIGIPILYYTIIYLKNPHVAVAVEPMIMMYLGVTKIMGPNIDHKFRRAPIVKPPIERTPI